ncbi:MAG: ECF-type sigma factor, partial [Planctomycetota bacterium]|nr:ECF-type sigma factor [Planctomycetota bacterium]
GRKTMPDSDRGDLTSLLARARDGDQAAAAEAFTRVYGTLHEIAEGLFAREATGHTLQPTVIVNECWLKLQGPAGTLDVPDLAGRSHFYAIAARSMRQILVDYARRRERIKRGRDVVTLRIDDVDKAEEEHLKTVEVLEVHEALDKLATKWPRAAEGVELRYFAGCSNQQIAETLQVSVETIKKDWKFATTWLYRELSGHA